MSFLQVRTPRGTFGVRRHGPAGEDGELALVSAGHRVAAPNLRGYAPSPLEGPLGLEDLVEDFLSVLDALSPDAPVHLVGHDYGAQLAYPVMARAPHRFLSAVLLSGAHPAFVQRNARRSLRQLWMSRYIVLFQLGRRADRHVAAHDFAYVETLWRRWAPGFAFPAEHGAHVKDTLPRSMPAPVAMYRGGGFAVPRDPIPVPTLFVTGADDGCALPLLADGQDALFTGGYTAQTWDGTGHFPHLEQPRRTSDAVIGWIGGARLRRGSAG